MTAREELAAVLAEHQRRADRSGACHCGEWPASNFGVPWTDHVADALLASPYAERISEREAELEVEVARLRAWKREAMTLFDGLQDLGRALGLPLGTLITGPAAIEAATALQGQGQRVRDVLEDPQHTVRRWVDDTRMVDVPAVLAALEGTQG